MDTIFTLRITKRDRDALIRAVEAMADEYRHAAEQVYSRYLATGFQNDATQFDGLAAILKNLADRVAVNEVVRLNLAAGNKINAIKAVRERTSMGLKEAKDYVDNFTTDPNYGVGII